MGLHQNIVSDLDVHIIETVDNLDFTENNVMLDEPITAAELEMALGQMKFPKAAGSDSIIPELLLNAKHILFPFLLKIYRYVFHSGDYPNQWAEGILHLIHKKGDTNDPGNYRDITLLNCIGKLYDRILYNRLKTWEADLHILSESQVGFRAGYSTVDHIFTLNSLVTKAFIEKKNLYCGFIDIKQSV
jgi:hypothetical protein